MCVCVCKNDSHTFSYYCLRVSVRVIIAARVRIYFQCVLRANRRTRVLDLQWYTFFRLWTCLFLVRHLFSPIHLVCTVLISYGLVPFSYKVFREREEKLLENSREIAFRYNSKNNNAKRWKMSITFRFFYVHSLINVWNFYKLKIKYCNVKDTIYLKMYSFHVLKRCYNKISSRATFNTWKLLYTMNATKIYDYSSWCIYTYDIS